MSSVKRWLKNFFYSTGNARLLDTAIYRWSKFTHASANNRYKKEHPGVPLPPAYFLYETYMPDYEKYMEDGRVAAQEIIEWIKPHLPMTLLSILEWGCGVARIVRHIPGSFHEFESFHTGPGFHAK